MKKSTYTPANPTASLAEFQPNPDNPQRYGDDEIAALVESIRKEPRTLGAAKIAFCTDYTATNGASYAGRRVVIAGNKRLQALQQIAREGGLRDPGDASAWLVSPQGDAPAAWFFDLTPLGPDARRHWLLESNIGRGEWDAEKLLAQFTRDELADHFDADALQEILDAAETDEAKDGKTDADSVPSAPETPVSKRGEVYQCGEHRLMCGDSTSAADVTRLMDGEKADIMFTSPPYSDMREYRGGKDLSVAHLQKFITVWSDFTNYECVNLGIQRKDHEIVQYWDGYIAEAHRCGLKLLAWNIWDKGSPSSVGQQSAFIPIRHEWIFVFGKETFEINRTWKKKDASIKQKSTQTGRRQSDGSIKVSSRGDTSHRLKQMESVCLINPEAGKIRGEHPATFPVALPSEYIKALTDEHEIVSDPFGGSGTTMIAAESLGRKARLMELDPHYCDVIRKRWAEFVHGEGCDWQALTPKTK